MADNIVAVKTENFAIRMVKLAKYLMKKKEFEMSTQIKRSGTSIGANVVEGIYAQSKKDFVSKMQIALKECSETQYWLRVLHKTDYISDKEFNSIYPEAIEIGRLLSSIIITAKKSINNKNSNGGDLNFEVDDK